MKLKRLHYHLILILFSGIIAGGCKYLFPSGEEAVTAEPGIQGSWKLVSFVAENSTGQEYFPLGENILGLSMYDSTGNMAVQIMNDDVRNLSSNDPYFAPNNEIRMAYLNYYGYYGYYRVDSASNLLIHYITGCSLPNVIGETQQRKFYITGDTLRIQAPQFLLNGVKLKGWQTWVREK